MESARRRSKRPSLTVEPTTISSPALPLDDPAPLPSDPGRSMDGTTATDSSPLATAYGHEYRHISARENARLHLGDNYVEKQVNYWNERPSASTEAGTKQIDVLEALAFENMNARVASVNVAHNRTCDWFFGTEEYVGWRRCLRHRSRRRILWIKGKPGAGKSTLMGHILRHAPAHFRHSIIAAYFFNARGYGAAKTLEGMYRTLLHQILLGLPILPAEVPVKFDAGHIWEISALQNMFRSAVLGLGEIESLVCYIDALDECQEDDIRAALVHFDQLRELAVSHGLKILFCFASRHYPNITIPHHRAVNLDQQPQHEGDISRYVYDTLRISGTLGAELHQTINTQCAGVFLWSVLIVQLLNKMYDQGNTRSRLQPLLRKTPSDIRLLFRDILKERDMYLMPALVWVMFAQRGLTVKELYFAVTTSTDKLSTGRWDTAEIGIEGMRNFVITSSRGLIEFSQGEAQLIHESLRDYLLHGGLIELDNTLHSDLESHCHQKLAQWCQAYVELGSSFYLAHKPGSYNFKGRQYELPQNSRLQSILGDSQYETVTSLSADSNIIEQLLLLEYVLSNMVSHLQAITMEGALLTSMLSEFAKLWMSAELYRFSKTATRDCAVLLAFSLDLACKEWGHEALTCRLSASSHWSKNNVELYGDTTWRYLSTFDYRHGYVIRDATPVLQLAASEGAVDVVHFFEKWWWKEDFQILLQEALLFSAGSGLSHVVDLFSSLGVLQKSSVLMSQVLMAAIVNLRPQTTEQLLKLHSHKLDCKVCRMLMSYTIAVETPALFVGDKEEARLQVVTVLLDFLDNSDTKPDPKSCLYDACVYGRSNVVSLLIERGLLAQSEGDRALRAACLNNRTDVIRILRDAGVVETYQEDSADDSDTSKVAVLGQW